MTLAVAGATARVAPPVYPQRVDDGWGRRCGPARSVVAASTIGDRASSTELFDTPGKTGGERGGRPGKTSYRDPIVDPRSPFRPGCPQVIHGPRAGTTCGNRRLSPGSTTPMKTTRYLFEGNRTFIVGVDVGARVGQHQKSIAPHQPRLTLPVPSRTESEPSAQEASHEVSG